MVAQVTEEGCHGSELPCFYWQGCLKYLGTTYNSKLEKSARETFYPGKGNVLRNWHISVHIY